MQARRQSSRNRKRAPLLALAGVAVALAGCATVDPTATVAATAGALAERGVPGVDWRRDAGAEAVAVERSRALLAAPLTPETAAGVALLRSPALQAELAELGVAQAELAQATRFANPGLEFERLSGDGESTRTIGLAADVVDWLTQPLRRRLAETELERVKLEVGAAVIEAVTEARLATVELQAATALVGRLEAIEALDRAAADYATVLHAAGNLTLLDRTNAEARAVETKLELGEARAELVRSREALLRTLGLSAAESFEVAPFDQLPDAPAGDPAALEALALERRLDLAAARWAVDAVERARRLHLRTRWLPVGIEVGVEREREGDDVTLSGPTVSLELPIFDRGEAETAAYDAELARARSQLLQLELVVRSEVREKASDLAAARDAATLVAETLLPLRLRALDLTLREYNQMIIGTFEVIEAKEDEIEAERHAIASRAEAWRARIELERALGMLNGEATAGEGAAR